MNKAISSPQRSSNLELYRIVCMLMIVAHHFVLHSGLMDCAISSPVSPNSIFVLLLGMWGKTGINCFLMITGYFMCTKKITLRKFLKLLLEVYFYSIVIYLVFLAFGYETAAPTRVFVLLMPIWHLSTNFTSCFLAFYLTIPFLNILIQNMTRKQHALLILLMLGLFSVLGSIPTFFVALNFVTWFGIIYLVASYIRLYPAAIYDNNKVWGPVTLVLVMMAIGSVVFMQLVFKKEPYYFVSNSHRIFAALVAISSFLWFKNLKIKHSAIINTIGASAFGVFLIHDNSDAMRQWLWNDFINGASHLSDPLPSLILFSLGCVLAIFIACTVIDILRIRLIESPFFRWFDNNPRVVSLTEKVERKLTES